MTGGARPHGAHDGLIRASDRGRFPNVGPEWRGSRVPGGVGRAIRDDRCGRQPVSQTGPWQLLHRCYSTAILSCIPSLDTVL